MLPAGSLPPVVLRFVALAVLGAVGVVIASTRLMDGTIAQGGIAAALYLGAALVAAWGMSRTYPHASVGLCNAVTLLRLALAVTLVTPAISGNSSAQWAIFWTALLALCLDGLDGWLARRQGLCSRFGARFDMEVDAALGLILAINAFVLGAAGAVVLLLGLPRYVFGAAGLVLPWIVRPLPDRAGRKLACVIQIAALIALQAPILPQPLAGFVVAGAAMALGCSFGRDILWLWRRRG